MTTFMTAARTDASVESRTCPVAGNAVITTTLTRPGDEATTLVPVIDLWSHGSAGAVADACARLGFFKVVNHGIPADVVEKLEASALTISMPMQVSDDPASASFKLGYGHRNIGAHGDAGSLEFLPLSIGSDFVSTSALPTVLRCALAEYTGRGQKVADRVLRLVAQGLGMEDTGVFSRMVRRDGSDELLRVNHYPPAMRAEAGGGGATAVFGEHTYPQIISVLQSNSVPGLQIALRDGSWLPVEPDPEALFVNVGDAMQVMTNGRYRSVRHRVVASEEAGKRARLSMIFFGGPAPWERIAPVKELTREEGEARLYRSFTWGEYKAAACKTRLGDHRLNHFGLNGEESLA